MNNFKAVLVAYFALVLCACKDISKNKEPKQERRPNIILILTDDQGWGDLSFNDNINLNTPNIDHLAHNGVSFENFYVQPVCSPTRAEVLTGKYFPRLGVYSTSSGGERMRTDVLSLAEVLKKLGYRTAAYGKWHNGSQPPYHPNSRGFDDFYGFTSGHWGNYFSPTLEHNGEIVQGDGFIVDDFTNRALEFIETNPKHPFFLYLPYNTPHSPMQVPFNYWKGFKEKKLQMFYGGDGEDIVFTKAALAMVENIDFNVGRILNKLQKTKQYDDTILIYLSDNGPNSFRWNGGMRGRKGWVDEGGVRTPFFIQWPNTLPSGLTLKNIAGSIDLMPTILNLVTLKNDIGKFWDRKDFDGRDLSPLLLEKNPKWYDRLIYNHWNGKTSVRSQRFRLDDKDRLYDIENDRGQKKDISKDFQEIKDSLIDARQNWIDEVGINKTINVASRPFTVGGHGLTISHLPARDGVPHGSIKRSNPYPNDSYFTNWKSVNDSITWDVEVMLGGRFEIELYYTMAKDSRGSIIELSLGDSKLISEITQDHDPPLTGRKNDLVVRKESYVKRFNSMKMGQMDLRKGKGILTLKALKVFGNCLDVRLLLLRRVK